MRGDVESILRSKGQCYFDLSLSSRLLLVTDGTVTELLEALVGEPVEIGFKYQTRALIDNHPDIQPRHNITEYLERAITLRGTTSATDWLYAESVVFHQLLTPAAQEMLTEDRVPIGIVLREHTSDNHRKLIDCGFNQNATAAEILDMNSDYRFLYRKYKVLVGPNTVMDITEWFPISRIDKKLAEY